MLQHSSALARLLGSLAKLRRRAVQRKYHGPGVARVSSCAILHPSVRLNLEYGGLIEILAKCQIMEGVILATYGGSIIIHEDVFVGPYCVLYGHGGLTIGRNTLIAAHTVVIPASHGFADTCVPIRQQKMCLRGIEIAEDVWIGCGVSILDGVTIGKGCVVGAGAVVNKSLDEYSIAVGVPAKVVGRRAPYRPVASAEDQVGLHGTTDD